jgi:hypothetical protein
MRRSVAAAIVGVASCIPIADLVTGGDGGSDAGSDAGGDVGDAPDGDGGATCPGAFAGAVMALPGLLGYWRLDETSGSAAADRTAKHPGTYLGAVTQGLPGLLQGDPDLAAGFHDDGGSLVDIPAAADLDLQTFTLGAIIQPSAIVAADMGQQIIAKNLAYWLQLDAPTNAADSPHLEVGFISPGSIDHPISAPSAALAVGATTFVVGTYDGVSVVVYVNGSLLTLVPLQAAIQTTPGHLYVGSWDGTSHFQSGVIDEVFVSGTAITALQVRELYLAAQGCAQGGG